MYLYVGKNFQVGVVVMRPFNIPVRERYKSKYVFSIVLMSGKEPENINPYFEELCCDLKNLNENGFVVDG